MSRILCVDDVAENLKLLECDLEDEGFEVVTASGGAEALELISTKVFSAVILDWMMPGLSGIDTLKTLRKEQSAVELPVIMATALNESSNMLEALEALEAGANDYVTKPIKMGILLARLRSHLRVRELSEALRIATTIDALTGAAKSPAVLCTGATTSRIHDALQERLSDCDSGS